MASPYPTDDGTHFLLPVVVSRPLRDEDKIGASGNASHQRQPAAMPAHDLNYKGPRVRRCGGLNVVNHLADAGQGRVAANGGISARQVIVDGTHEANNIKMLVG